MTPGQARIVLLAFSIVTAGVTANAFFLQPRTMDAASAAPRERPRPGAGSRHQTSSREAPQSSPSSHRWTGGSEGLLRITRFAPAMRQETPEEEPQLTASATTVAAIQRELSARGYGPLPGDGLLGLATRAGIMAFEHDHGLPLTGEASEELLKRILLGTAVGGGPTEQGARTVQAAQVVRKVQQGLAALGYRIARVDGRLGEDSLKAIRDFEVDRGLVPKGRISAEIVAHLNEAAARSRSAR
jgi:peptidoglycan hydrolase-like protein with peptidoglycan-binding domain